MVLLLFVAFCCCCFSPNFSENSNLLSCTKTIHFRSVTVSLWFGVPHVWPETSIFHVCHRKPDSIG